MKLWRVGDWQPNEFFILAESADEALDTAKLGYRARWPNMPEEEHVAHEKNLWVEMLVDRLDRAWCSDLHY